MFWKLRLSTILSTTVLLLAGCGFDATSDRIINEIRSAANSQKEDESKSDIHFTSTTKQPLQKSDETVKIASFNIQVFGVSKMKKTHVTDILAQIVRRFDIVAIQEIRSKDQTILPQFVELVNANGAAFNYVIGPRLGRTTSKEQYAYVYDTSRIKVHNDSIYTINDSHDLLHREPLIATFSVRNSSNSKPFSFTLINIHTDPDETDTELDALDDVFTAVQRHNSDEDDVILLGDLNVDYRHLGELGQIRNIAWTVQNQMTNTRGTKSYDNILFDRQNTVEFTGNAGVLNLMTEFSLSEKQALEVSDHFPVWAEFHLEENRPARIATNNE